MSLLAGVVNEGTRRNRLKLLDLDKFLLNSETNKLILKYKCLSFVMFIPFNQDAFFLTGAF